MTDTAPRGAQPDGVSTSVVWELVAKRIAFLYAPDPRAAVNEALAIYREWGRATS